ncbi:MULTISPECIES: ATP-binding cassette domain-containing protein [unclassified Roseateles]|uniref:ATP-binding cassette domain-containing protein n=1 Tax=unclassified Roseateles TaxID=2626991 RepID=UPI000A607AEE|nr:MULTISPECIES: ATP-binding cassette domain-containing protein [unclassified Roseateles]
MSNLWDALRPWRRPVLLALALLVLSKLAAVAVPGMLKAIVDHLSPDSATVALSVPFGLLAGYALLRFAAVLFTELRDLVFSRVGKQVVSGFSERAFAHLLAMSPRFHAKRNTGALVREVERGIAGIGYLLGAGVFTVLPTAVEFLVVLVIVSVGYGLSYVIVIGATMVAYAVWTGWKTRARVESQRAMNEHDTRAHGLLVDTLLNYEAVRTHGRESSERSRYREVLTRWVDGSVNSQKTLSSLHLGQAGIIAVGVGVVMLMAGSDTAAGRMSIGDLVMVNAYLIQVFLPLNTLGFVFRETRDALLNTEMLFGLLGQPPDIQDAPGAGPLQGSDTGVRFEHIDFGYEPQRRVLHDFSLEIPHGRTCAVVGSSGSGKSTLARLLMRMYEPDAGRVLIGGQPLQALTQQALRDTIGVVPQDPMLFNDTIAYNIGYGRPGAVREEIIAAARAAQADDFIRLLPDGYETLVGERGARLSGGEKQRIVIARAFLKNPPIMVLDEATSALDTRAERAIQGALERVSRDRTSLIIAHRLSTVVGADEIIVMDGGRIVERGRHEALLAQQGLYAQLWELQRQQQQAQTLERRLALHPVNLAALLVINLDSLHGELAAKRTEPYTNIDMGVANVIGDASRIARIVQLVCELALQGAERGRMEVRLERRGNGSQLTVGFHGHIDTAAGGAPDTLELRTLAGEAAADLSIQRDPAVGEQQYQLVFPLPAIVPSEPAWPESDTMPLDDDDEPLITDPRPLAGLTVLCVDDDEDALASLGSLLELDGAHTERVTSGQAALSLLAGRPVDDWPDVLLCDIALGAEDGHAVVRSVRAMEARREVPLNQRLPAIALTGLAQPEDRIRALAAGFQRHLAKPVAPDQLVRALRQLSRVHA